MKHYEQITHEYLQDVFRQLGPALHDTNEIESVEGIWKKPLADSIVYRIKDRTPKGIRNVYRHVRNGNLVSQIEGGVSFVPVPQSSKECAAFFQDALGEKYLQKEKELVLPAWGKFVPLIAGDTSDIFYVTTDVIDRYPHIVMCADLGNYVDFKLAILRQDPNFSKVFSTLPKKMELIREFSHCVAQGHRKDLGPQPFIPTEKDLANDLICLRYALQNLDILASPNLMSDEYISDKRLVEKAKKLAQRIGDYEAMFEKHKDALFYTAELRFQKKMRGSWSGLEQITKEWDTMREIG